MFFDIYSDLCDKKGVSCKKAAEEMGLSNSVTTRWKQRGSTPHGDTLKKIADYFGVSVSYLVGEEQKESPAVPAEPKKAELMKLVQGMSDEDVSKALEMFKIMFGVE